ncbi:MAG: hypothetical protein WD844_10940 [Thermoleophilaceae bacterium]
MLELLGAWLLFPLLLAAACLGLGLLTERLAGTRISGALILPLGFAALIVLAQTVTFLDPLAELATAVVVAAALAGLWLGRARLRPLAPCGWAIAAALVVFAAYAAPIVASGEATFAGYTLLGDSAIHFMLSDWVGEHGPHLGEDLTASSYSVALNTYIDTGYPTGTHAALAAVRPFGLQGVAWVYQPFLAFAAAMAALGVFALLRGTIRPHGLRALAGVLAAMPGLVYGYYLQGSVKEIVVVALLPLLAALAVRLFDRDAGGWRAVIPVAIVSAAALGALNLAAAPYIGPLALVALAALLLRRSVPVRERLLRAGALGVFTALLAVPTLASVSSFVRTAEVSLTGAEEVGNLLRPLSLAQVFGIWPRGDYRLALVEHVTVTHVLIGVVIVAAVFGLLFLLRRPAAGPLALAAATVIGSAYAIARGSPWADGKALMILSPVAMIGAMVGVESLRRSRRGIEAALVAAAIVVGVAWTNVLAYGWADLAPRDRLAELDDIAERIEGEGPTLYPEFEEFAKFFLRDAAPTGSAESWQPPPRATVVGGAGTSFGLSNELDQLDTQYVRSFPTIVLRRSPTGSRPPTGYELAFSTDSYEVWRRPADPALEVLAHQPVGEPVSGRGVPDCSAVEELVGRAREADGSLAFVPLPPVAVFATSQAPLPAGWTVDGVDALTVRPVGPGRVEGSITVPAAGRYEVWLQGSFSRPVSVELDGREVGSVEPRLSPRGGWERVGVADLGEGGLPVAVVRPDGGIAPGDHGRNRLIGPVVLRPVLGDPRADVERVPPAAGRVACEATVDWVEAIRG